MSRFLSSNRMSSFSSLLPSALVLTHPFRWCFERYLVLARFTPERTNAPAMRMSWVRTGGDKSSLLEGAVPDPCFFLLGSRSRSINPDPEAAAPLLAAFRILVAHRTASSPWNRSMAECGEGKVATCAIHWEGSLHNHSGTRDSILVTLSHPFPSAASASHRSCSSENSVMVLTRKGSSRAAVKASSTPAGRTSSRGRLADRAPEGYLPPGGRRAAARSSAEKIDLYLLRNSL
mmetsp:Transcript_24914/g.46057  ORF Transcript_24914/g.46057 Transcript_24914/m.46057 type:complete len:233 (+) Transcript_24914:2436-3134(+)